jgi:hypothetical protein
LLQMPPTQFVEQHSPSLPQAWPRTLQVPPPSVPHVPFVHVCVQHSPPPVHAAPTSLQAWPPHVPFVHCPRQQSVFEEHEPPAAAQNVLAVQTLPLQAPPQQGVDVLHGWPAVMHMPPSPPGPPSLFGFTPPQLHAETHSNTTIETRLMPA